MFSIQMSIQGCFLSEAKVALATWKGFFSSMYQNVTLCLGFEFHYFGTHRTFWLTIFKKDWLNNLQKYFKFKNLFPFPKKLQHLFLNNVYYENVFPKMVFDYRNNCIDCKHKVFLQYVQGCDVQSFVLFSWFWYTKDIWLDHSQE